MFRLATLALAIFASASATNAQEIVDPVWSVDDRIEETDARAGTLNRPYDEYLLRLEAGRTYSFSARSTAFDITIALYREGQDEALRADDDSGDGTNSFFRYRPSETGTYRFRVRSLGEGRGDYAARVEIRRPPPAEPLDVPGTSSGRIEDSDLFEGYREDYFSLNLEAGRRYRFWADSDDFDIWMRLVDEDARTIISDDDSAGDDNNAFLVFRPSESGVFLLGVRSVSQTGGAYSVRVAVMPALPQPLRTPPAQRHRLDWLLWEGELDGTDPDRDGRLFEDHALSMRAGETRFISVDSTSFDPVIGLLRVTDLAADPEADPIDMNDDAGPGFNALLGFHADRAGEYVVRVMAFGVSTGGRYRLRISQPLVPAITGPPVTDE